MRVKHEDAQMSAGGITRNFWITDDIAPDSERFNWDTYRWENVESTTSQKYFIQNLAGLGTGDRVNLYINSMGGSVKEALGIHSELKRCPATVTAYIDGFAASAASVIAMAASKVVMPRNTAMMIHNAAWCAYGNSAQLRKSADDLEVINMAAIQAYAMHAGDKLPADKLRALLDAETWLTAEECMQYGLADEFADTDVTVEAAMTMFKSGAQAAMSSQESWLFQAAPAFLEHYNAPATKRYQKPAAIEVHTSESGYLTMLVKSMTHET